MSPTAGSAQSKSPSQARAERAESDGPENLIDQARECQQPAPDDPCRNERDDLRQEQDGPGCRSELPGCHAMDHARDDKPERHRDKAKEHDQTERIEDGSEQVGILQDGLKFLSPTQVMGPMPSQRKNEYWMLNRRGSSTNAAYISSAGRTNSQPMMVSRRTILCERDPPGECVEPRGDCLTSL